MLTLTKQDFLDKTGSKEKQIKELFSESGERVRLVGVFESGAFIAHEIFMLSDVFVRKNNYTGEIEFTEN